MGLTPGQVAVKGLLAGWVTICRQVSHIGVLPVTKVSFASLQAN